MASTEKKHSINSNHQHGNREQTNQLYEDGYDSDGFEPIFGNNQDNIDMLESLNKIVPGQK